MNDAAVDKLTSGGVAALARFRKAGKTVIGMQRVTTLLHKPGLGRARTAQEANLRRIASIKNLQQTNQLNQPVTKEETAETAEDAQQQTILLRPQSEHRI